MSQFSKSLRDIRKKSGKKQREAAEYLGLNIRTYQYYEGGQSEPNISTLVKLADFFMVSLDELVGRDWGGR
ncbi:MAG: helix-turn-helix transcriptional regulator [Lawsonibacter sp.]|jgi:transcriptional regulator with XRE-family HTH domain|nr:helix-turn-helix transcriptional regulator [Lawsonibacter sp.]